MIEFKAPAKEQTDAMREFADALNIAFEVLVKRPMSNSVTMAANKLQEALMWHSQAILNEEVVLPAKQDEPLDGELVQAS